MTSGDRLNQGKIELTRDWELAVSRIIKEPGTTIVIGPPDAGKTSFIRCLTSEANDFSKQVRVIDADLGQKTIGPPATISSACFRNNPEGEVLPDSLYFIGDTTPYNHIVEEVTGLSVLCGGAEPDIDILAIDTPGLVTGPIGVSLNYHLIMAANPHYVVFIRRAQEMEPLISAISYRNGPKLFILDIPRAARRIPIGERRKNRKESFGAYFRKSEFFEISLNSVAVYPSEARSIARRELKGLLVGLQDENNRTKGMGIIMAQQRRPGLVTIAAPIVPTEVAGIVFGSLKIAPDGQELGRVKLNR